MLLFVATVPTTCEKTGIFCCTFDRLASSCLSRKRFVSSNSFMIFAVDSSSGASAEASLLLLRVSSMIDRPSFFSGGLAHGTDSL